MFRRCAMDRHRMYELAVVDGQVPKRGIAQPGRPFEHRVEHWREVARRGVDDLQHLGHGDLLSFTFVALG